MRDKKILSRIVALGLAGLILLGSGSAVISVFAQERAQQSAEQQLLTDTLVSNHLYRARLPYTETDYYEGDLPEFELSELVYEYYDFAMFQEVVNSALADIGLDRDNLTAEPSVEVNQADLEQAVNIILIEYDRVGALSSASYLAYADDVSNQEAMDAQTHMDKLGVDVFSETLEVLQGLQSNETLAEDFVAVVGETDSLRLGISTPYTVRQREISEEQTALIQLYDQTDPDDAEARGQIYIELVALNNEFNDIDESINPTIDDDIDEEYGEEYTEEDKSNFYEYVKDYMAPLYVYLSMQTDFNVLDRYSIPSGEALTTRTGKVIGNISSELKEAYDYMLDADLFIFGDGANAVQGSFTITIPYYNSAAVFLRDSSDYNNVSTLVHEFGHFNTAIRREGTGFFGYNEIDIAEIHAQGLEILFMPYAEIMFGDYGEGLVMYELLNMVWAVLTGCLIDEFETYAHDTANLTVEMLNAKMDELSREYMVGVPEDWWTDVRHIYEQPFYYISYAVSAMASMSLLSDMETSYELAVDKYMTLTTYEEGTYSFNKTLEESGFLDIFAEDSVREIANSLSNYMSDPTIFDIEDYELVEDDSITGDTGNTDDTDETTRGTVVPEFGGDNTEPTEPAPNGGSSSGDINIWYGRDVDIELFFRNFPTIMKYLFSGEFLDDLASFAVR